MELSEIRPQSSTTVRAKGDLPLRIWPFGDIQYLPDVPVDLDLFEEHVAQFMDYKGPKFAIGMGDYVDSFSPSNRARVDALKATGEFYDSTNRLIDRAVREAEDTIFKLIEPMKEHLIGLLRGHHYHTHGSDGTTSDSRLAYLLDCPFLNYSTMVRVRFEPTRKNTVPFFDFWAHHGCTGGRAIATNLTQMEKIMTRIQAQAYLMGHHHKTNVSKDARIRLRGERHVLRLDQEDVVLMGTGGYMKGFSEHNVKRNPKKEGGGWEPPADANYPEVKGMTPLPLGGQYLWAKPHIDGEGRASVRLGYGSL